MALLGACSSWGAHRSPWSIVIVTATAAQRRRSSMSPDPATRELYVDWPVVARDNVAILRHDVARHPAIRSCAS